MGKAGVKYQTFFLCLCLCLCLIDLLTGIFSAKISRICGNPVTLPFITDKLSIIIIIHQSSITGWKGFEGFESLSHRLCEPIINHKSSIINHQLSMDLIFEKSFSMIFSILTVALIAAAVWSGSRPRVLNS